MSVGERAKGLIMLLRREVMKMKVAFLPLVEKYFHLY